VEHKRDFFATTRGSCTKRPRTSPRWRNTTAAIRTSMRRGAC
jgi:hypothetical protein